MTKDYPVWVCDTCGIAHGKHRTGSSTYHMGICGVCLKGKSVTSPRDFGYPNFDKPKEEAK